MATYYVSTTGNNGSAGTSVGTAWLTIQHAANTAVAGDTVNILAGTYVERVTFPTSGTAGNRITFQGVRGGGGSWDTIIDGSTPVVTSWAEAPESGDGVYKTTLGYQPEAMTANNLHIWRIISSYMLSHPDSNVLSGLVNLAREPDELVESYISWDQEPPVSVLTPFWYGIEAMFGYTGGVTYLRFRDREHPSTMNVRAAVAGAVVTVNNQDYITVRDLKMQGGQWAMLVTGGSQETRVEGCYLTHGQYAFASGASTNTLITDTDMTLDSIGLVEFPGGDWNFWTPERIANRHRYNMDKFLFGTTDTDDSRLTILEGSTGLTVTTSRIYNTGQGVAFYQNSSGTTISYCEVHNCFDNGFYVYQESTASSSIHHNLIYDCDHLMRLQGTEVLMQLNIYANRWYQPWFDVTSGPKHVFFRAPDPPLHPSSDVRFYQNTFAGGGYALDNGGAPFPYVHVRNNIFATSAGLSSGGADFGTIQDNLFNNAWAYTPMPDFMLPPDHIGIDTAPSLISLGWEGMDTAYYVDGLPDYGAIQAGVEEDTEAPSVAITAPMNAAIVSGASVSLTATADDNVAVVGVQFKRGGSTNIGAEDTSAPYAVTWDTTGLADGVYALTAVARDAAGNTTTSSTVTVTVDNTPGVDFPGDVAGLGATGGGAVTFLGDVTDLGVSATSTVAFLGEVTSLGVSATGTVTFLGEVTGLDVE